MSSGVQVNPDCLSDFEAMKIRSAYGYIIFKITADKKFIEVRIALSTRSRRRESPPRLARFPHLHTASPLRARR